MQNAFNHFGQGWDQAQGVQDQLTRQRAGNALAAGDYQAGGNALLQGGMLTEGLATQKYGQNQQPDPREATEKLEFFGKAAQMLRRLPPEARPGAVGQLQQTFKAMGLPDDMIGQIGQADLSDQSLDLFAGKVEEAKAQIFQMRDGSLVQWNGTEAQRVYEAPEDPLQNELARARIAATKAQEVQRRASAGASSARAAKTRSGGGGGGAGLPPPPAGWSR